MQAGLVLWNCSVWQCLSLTLFPFTLAGSQSDHEETPLCFKADWRVGGEAEDGPRHSTDTL